MRKIKKIGILLILLAVVLSALFFINIQKVYAEPNNPLNGNVAIVQKTNCDGRELNEFVFAGNYSMTESGSGFLVNLSISGDMVNGIKSITNTTSWTKQIIFNVNGVSSASQKIDGTTGGGMSATISLPSARYNQAYSLSITVSGTHGYIGHGNHGWSMTASTSISWSKVLPTLALRGATNNGYTNTAVTVTSPTADATIEYRHNSGAVTSAAADGYSQNFTAEGKHSFKIYNNDDADGRYSEYSFIIDKSAPIGTLSGVTDKGYTNTSFTWADAPNTQAPITVMINDSAYIKGAAITAEGKHTIVLKDAAGNTTSYTFTIDKTAPTGMLNGVVNNGYTSGKVSFSWEDASKIQSPITATLNGADYKNDRLISAEGNHTVVLKDAAGNTTSYTFIIDKTAPIGTLTGVTDKGYTNTNVSFSWADASNTQAPITAILNGNSYIKGTSLAAEGKHTIVLKDAAGNSTTYTFTIDKIAPTGTLSGVANGGQTSNNVSFAWSDTSATATLNGSSYTSERGISDSGNYTIILTDRAGNSSTYTFKIDKTRPYLTNLDYIKSIFSLSTSDGNKLSSGQVGNFDITLGRALPGIEFNWADELSTVSVMLTQSLYHYNITTGEYIIGNATSSSVAGNIKVNKPGEYIMRAKDALGNEITLRFILGASIKFTLGDFVHKTDRYILGNESVANIISYNTGGNLAGATIIIDGTNTNLQALTLDNLKSYSAGKREREKSARVKLVSNVNGVECIYFDYQIGYDFSDADIHNLADLPFEGGSGSYLGTIKPGAKIDFCTLATELDETATLIQTLYAYDSRNVLYIKEEQSVTYVSGLIISNIGYYVLRITDGARVTEYTFKVMDEFKSANEFALKNEYFIAPEYNLVKFPMSFGAFNISHHENIPDTYLGKYSAEKQYLFSATENTAQAFAFASEYSVCVQKTATGYLYRAKNQGIQVAYNSTTQLNAKIREVIKEYISYKSMKMTDSQSIDYSNQIIMDESIKYNGNYQNVAAQIVDGVTYGNIMLINKSFVFKTNAGRDALSSLAKITIINIVTRAVFDVKNGMPLSEYTELNGLYEVEENCPGSNTILIYYVYLDNVAPTADIMSTKADGNDVEQTVTAADTIVLQVAEFRLKSVNDLIDNYCLVYITGYGFSDAIPMRKSEMKNIHITTELGHKGAYTIEIYDRSKNKFSFMLYIMGAPPTAAFTKSGSGDTERVILNIMTTDKYCTVMELSIYRNKSDSNSGELLVDSNDTQISPAVLSYTFNQGGRYTVVIVDNFSRTTTNELRYIKDMPNIAVEGLNKERRVNKDITVTLPFNCLYTIVTAKNSTITVDSMTDTSKGIIVIVIRPRNEYNELVYLEDKVTIKAWYDTDPDSYNDLSYMLDTIAPTISATAENGESLTGKLFKQAIMFDYDLDVKSIDVQRSGRYFSYTKGQVIRLDGEYIVSATDIAGNIALLQVVLDMTVDYSFTYGENKSYLSGIEKVGGRAVVLVKSLILTANEQISVHVTKDGYILKYSMVEKISAAGLYKFELSDNAGNVAVLDYRVLPAVQEISLHSEDGSLISYNSTTNQSAYLDWDDLSYIKSVSYKQSSSMGYNDYIKKELITKSGSYTATVTDVLSNTLDIRVSIDKEVNIDIKYDKSYVLEEINGSANTLTKRFAISLSEPNISLSIKLNGELISYTLGSWLIANGQYEIDATDAVGNVHNSYIAVVGESLPNVNITSVSGTPIADTASVKEGFTIAWSDSDYIARVDVNYSRISNGTVVTADGKYTIDIIDLLDRTRTMTVWIKTKINYTINYQGSYYMTENSIDYFLTRGFSFISEDSLEITATKNGESFALSTYRTYSAAGDYMLNVADIAGNSETINIKVVESAYVPKIKDQSGTELVSGAITNKQFEIVHSVFIAKILVNGQAYNYGDYISYEGKNKIEVVDVIGRYSVMFITIDTLVNCEITYGKMYEKTAQVLTDRFKANMNEYCTVIARLNGIDFEFKQGISYITTGLYELTIIDSLGNVKNLTIEVDNRMPKINVLDKNSNEITRTNINEEFYLTWDESLNIQEVKVNGATIDSGACFALAGRYEISITNYLGASASKVIVIQDSVIYELTTQGNSYEYTSGDNAIILSAGFSITGASIVKIEGKLNGAEITIVLGKSYNVDGLYEVTLTDNASNTITLNINVLSKAIKGGVEIAGSEWAEDIAINTSFSIVGHQFIKEIYINGVLQAVGSEYNSEGVYNIEYIDVLGRKASQRVVIDKSVALTWEYALIKTIDDIDIYLTKILKLSASETLTYVVYRDDVLLDNFDETQAFKINGLYYIVAKDALSNNLAFYVRIDNLAPVISVGEPKQDNSVFVSVHDDIGLIVEVYLNGELYASNGSEFTLKKNGKFTIVAHDELGNKIEQIVSTDMEVSLSYNFLMGQSINFKPTFTANEIISYELYRDDILVENYKINDALREKGKYRFCAKDELNNSIEITFEYHGNSRKQPLMNYKLPNINGLIYKVLFEGQPIEIEAVDGVLVLSQTGSYTIVYTIGGREQSYSIDIINTPPKIKLNGYFESKEDLRTSKIVGIESAAEYKMYRNGIEIKSGSSVDKVGKYKVVATDEVGNVSEIEFVIYYAPNGGTILLIITITVAAVIMMLVILKRKGVFNRKISSKRKKASQ